MSDEIVILFQGKVSASGRPSDLLERPPNSYVASFLGGWLVLRGVAHVLGRENVMIETSAGRLELLAGTRVSEGQEVEVYVRPSLTRLSRDGAASNRLQGVVTGLTREADALEYHIAVGDQIVKVQHDLKSGWAPAIRESVFIDAPPDACSVVGKS